MDEIPSSTPASKQVDEGMVTAEPATSPPGPPPSAGTPGAAETTWGRATLTGFESGATPPEAAPSVTVGGKKPEGGKKLIAALATLVVAAGAVGGWMLLRGASPEPVVLSRTLEAGNTYVYRVAERRHLNVRTSRFHRKFVTSLDGLVSLKVRSNDGGGVRMRGTVNPHTVVVNERPIAEQTPLRAKIRIRPDGFSSCSEPFTISDAQVDDLPVGEVSLGPPLPSHAVSPEDTWSLTHEGRCKKTMFSYKSVGTFDRYEEEDDGRRIAVVSALTTVELGTKRGQHDVAVLDETARLDAATGRLLSAEGRITFDARLRLPAARGEMTDLKGTGSYRLTSG